MKIGGKYELGEVLGMGGMGKVWAAVHQSSNGFSKRCVVKVLHSELSDSDDLIAMFQQEARLVGQMAHPGIPQVFDHGVDNGQAYFVMERVEGPTLQQVISRLRYLKRQVPVAIAARIVASVAEALAYAHALTDERGKPLGIIHRDVSPDNVMIDQTGVVKLTDFGVARVTRSVVRTDAGVTRGKAKYMSPEHQAAGVLSPRSDVFALGVVLCELLTLQHPWPGKAEAQVRAMGDSKPRPLESLRPDVPLVLADIVRHALAYDAAARTPDCRTVQTSLETFITSTGKAVTAYDVAEWLKSLDADATGVTPLSLTVTERASTRRVWPVVLAAIVGVGFGVGWFLRPAPGIEVAHPSTSLGTNGAPSSSPAPSSPAPASPAPPAPSPPPLPPPEPVVEVRPVPAPVEKRAAPKRMGTVELRVRPWAQVSIDGKPVGETPVKDLQLTLGRHTLRLINTELGKDLTVSFDVRPGRQQLKYNLTSP